MKISNIEQGILNAKVWIRSALSFKLLKTIGYLISTFSNRYSTFDIQIDFRQKVQKLMAKQRIPNTG